MELLYKTQEMLPLSCENFQTPLYPSVENERAVGGASRLVWPVRMHASPTEAPSPTEIAPPSSQLSQK